MGSACGKTLTGHSYNRCPDHGQLGHRRIVIHTEGSNVTFTCGVPLG